MTKRLTEAQRAVMKRAAEYGIYWLNIGEGHTANSLERRGLARFTDRHRSRLVLTPAGRAEVERG